MQILKFLDVLDNVKDIIKRPIESGLEYYVGLEHLDSDEIDIKRFGSTNDVKAHKLLAKKGDIIFGKRNAYLRKLAIADRNVVVSAHAMILRCKNLDKYDILTYYLQSSEFWKIAYSISEGSMSPTIKWRNLCNKEIILPDEYVENKIVSILDKVQENINVTRQFLDENTILKQGLMNKLLTKGIGHKKFKKVKLIDAKRWNEKAERWEDQLEEIPEYWSVETLGNITQTMKGGGTPKVSNNLYYDGNIPFAVIADITSSKKFLWSTSKTITESGLKNSSAWKVPINSILYSQYASYGIPIINKITVATNQAITGMIIKTDKYDLDYIYYQLVALYPKLDVLLQTTSQENLNSYIIKSIPIPICSLSEQKAIADILSNVDEQISLTEKKIELLKKLKKKLIDDIFSGKMEIEE
jgi:type I restriction enzyme S subunit